MQNSCEHLLSSEHKLIRKRALIDEKLLIKYLKKYAGRSYTNVLDVACGAGITTHILNKTLDITNVYGIDIDPRVIEYAGCMSEENMIFQVGNALCVPYESKYFDFTFSRMLFEVCPHPEKIVEEAIRVTKPGGRVLFWGNIESTPSIFPAPMHYNKYLEAEKKIIRATKKYSYNPLELYNIFEKKGLKKIEFFTIVKDTNNFTKEELTEYYFENHDYKNSLLIKLGMFTAKELQEYDRTLLEIMKSRQSYYFYLQYYITAIVGEHY